MSFNSYEYAAFLPLVAAVYYMIPRNKGRNILLLLSSYFFYMSWNKKLIFLIIGLTLVSYVGAILMEKYKRMRKIIVVTGISASLAVLFVFKYLNFCLSSASHLIHLFAGEGSFTYEGIDILLPVGISFYTFQSLSYLVDVYKNKISVERNIIDYSLYISFFPQLVAGPIERPEHFIPQLKKIHKLSFLNIRDGLVCILWGIFKKIVVADRMAMLVDEVYNNLDKFSGISILLATLFFSIQIYCDFSAYSEIAVGSAKIFGFDLMENFDVPYLSGSVKEFWHRWHISLSSWFRDYVYIPLGGSRVSKFRTRVNVLVTFMLSGLWHGANWTYVIWGSLHGAFQVIESIIFRKKDEKVNVLICYGRTFLTFTAVTFAWIFFRANTVSDAFYVVRNLFKLSADGFLKDWAVLAEASIDKYYMMAVGIALFILMIADLLKKKRGYYWFAGKQNDWVLVLQVVCISAVILVFGVYGPMYDAAAFIYFQF